MVQIHEVGKFHPPSKTDFGISAALLTNLYPVGSDPFLFFSSVQLFAFQFAIVFYSFTNAYFSIDSNQP